MQVSVPSQWELGWVEVICGGMFSGKTEELIRRIKRAQIARQDILLFKPKVDSRFSETSVVSHSSQNAEAIPIQDPEEILEQISPTVRVVGIDEAQFFPHSIVPVTQRLADNGMRVIIAGLDLDYRGIPFGAMPELMAIAEYVTKMQAICTSCGAPASRSQRLPAELEHSDQQFLLGAEDRYQARCRKHFQPNLRAPLAENLTLSST